MNNISHPREAAAVIASRIGNFSPKLILVLGSGLGRLADEIKKPTIIPYSELPGFPVSSVAGHAGRLVLGMLNGFPVACMQGRVHTYEGVPPQSLRTMIRSLKLIGCEIFFATNASGSLREDVPPGSLMLINDHINFQGTNSLVGPNDDEFGPRFVTMTDVYDPLLRHRLKDVAIKCGITLAEGVYISVLGPCFETPAEIRAFRVLGADAVGMSTVPEVIMARHCGLRVAVVAAITNFASGMTAEKITHEGTLYHANLAADNLSRLVTEFIGSLQKDPC